VWTQYLRTGKRSTKVAKDGIERAMVTDEGSVFAGDTQIAAAQEARTKKRARSFSEMETALRESLPLAVLQQRAKGLELQTTETDATALLQLVLEEEDRQFSATELKPLFPATSKLGVMLDLKHENFGKGVVFDKLYVNGDPQVAGKGSHAIITLAVPHPAAVRGRGRDPDLRRPAADMGWLRPGCEGHGNCLGGHRGRSKDAGRRR
jgi:hypothetical protein